MNFLTLNSNTPFVKVELEELNNIQLCAKLEYLNPTGSVKDRAASFILQETLRKGIINQNTTIVESSSGNLGVALAAYCKKYALRLIVVIDPHISPINEMLIKRSGAEIVKVTTPDSGGGYLLNRIKKVSELLSEIPNSYWIDQYRNPLNRRAYYLTLGSEICDEADNVDYLFLGVSSGGTIAGVSQRVKEKYPKARVIAVDIEGSVIFGGNPSKRYIPGIGASKIPANLKYSAIDDVVIVNEKETIESCHKLLNNHSIFAGGSSGSVIAAIEKFFRNKNDTKLTNVVTIFADRGERYIDSIYNEQWCSRFFEKNESINGHSLVKEMAVLELSDYR